MSFVAFAERLAPRHAAFAGSFQNQGKRLLKYLPARLYEIDKVVSALSAPGPAGRVQSGLDLVRRR